MFTTNKRVLASIAGIFSVGLVPSTALAQAAGSAANTFDMQAAATIGASLAIGLAVLGGALGQGCAAVAALVDIVRPGRLRARGQNDEGDGKAPDADLLNRDPGWTALFPSSCAP